MQQAASGQTARPDELIVSFRAVIDRVGGRLTHERLAILTAVREMRGHFFAEDLARRLRKRGLRISLATVYRNLPLLVEAGVVRRACVSDDKKGGGASYEQIWDAPHHDHLVCSHCGKRVEFSYPAIDVLQEAVAQSYGFRLERHHLELIGECADCQRAEADS
jgi:Fur family ferric uptake transcriptional regulator